MDSKILIGIGAIVSMYFWGAVSSSASDVMPAPSIFTEWVALNYTWDATHKYEDYVADGMFVVENCLLAGINVDALGDIYLTVPRWRSGVPATLNKLNIAENTLTPFPAWDIQREGVKGDLQNVQSMTIDRTGTMWVGEVGRRNFFDGDAIDGAPGIWWIDTATGAVKDQYYFAEDIVSSSESFLNDIALDEDRNVAYLSDAWGDGAIIVFDYNTRTSRRYSGESTKNDPSYKMVINGINYSRFIFTTPIDGITITPDGDAIFYSQVQGTTLYRVPTAVLRDFTTKDSAIDEAVEKLGTKEPSDGIKYLNGRLYWGSLTTSTYYTMMTDATAMSDPAVDGVAAELSPEDMHWVDTFAIDLSDQQTIWITSNRLDRYSVHKMDFSGGEGANMRVMFVKL